MLLLQLLLHIFFIPVIFTCPEQCLCNENIVDCKGKKFTKVPSDIPLHTYRLLVFFFKFLIILDIVISDLFNFIKKLNLG